MQMRHLHLHLIALWWMHLHLHLHLIHPHLHFVDVLVKPLICISQVFQKAQKSVLFWFGDRYIEQLFKERQPIKLSRRCIFYFAILQKIYKACQLHVLLCKNCPSMSLTRSREICFFYKVLVLLANIPLNELRRLCFKRSIPLPHVHTVDPRTH